MSLCGAGKNLSFSHIIKTNSASRPLAEYNVVTRTLSSSGISSDVSISESISPNFSWIDLMTEPPRADVWLRVDTLWILHRSPKSRQESHQNTPNFDGMRGYGARSCLCPIKIQIALYERQPDTGLLELCKSDNEEIRCQTSNWLPPEDSNL